MNALSPTCCNLNSFGDGCFDTTFNLLILSLISFRYGTKFGNFSFFAKTNCISLWVPGFYRKSILKNYKGQSRVFE